MNTSTLGIAAATLLLGGALGFGIGNNAKPAETQANMQSSNSSTEKPTESDASSNVDGVTVGGAKMVRNLDIVDNAANASNVTTVVSLVKQAGLVETLKGVGPFTVFGPNNAAFEAVPKPLLDKVGGNKELLTTVLTYHVVPGTYTSADLRAMANMGTKLKTVQGAELSFKIVGDEVNIMDVAGQSVAIETPDVISSNGVTHVVKSVMLPVDPATL